MKKILHIARNELATLFYSPIAWLLMIFFMIMTSIDFTHIMEKLVGGYQRGGIGLFYIDNLTYDATADKMLGYFHNIMFNLYMLFPLVTMGLISREVSSGSIKLLYSSPIRVRDIVLGKFLAVLSFTACLIVLVGCTVVAFCIITQQPDYSQLIFSLLGVFLLMLAYAAIGLFVSTLTSYALVAALITLAIFALLTNIGTIGQDIVWLREITSYLNITEKSTSLICGLFNLRDCAYFLIIITSFLAFSIIRLRAATESVTRTKKVIRYLMVIGMAGIAGAITSSPYLNFYFDSSRNELNTISRPTRAMLRKLDDGPLEIIVAANLLFGDFRRFTPEDRSWIDRFLWDPYIRFKPDIRVRYVN
ncbi:MAG: ABC transporter permease subunit, partial [Chitinophagaceae bacterium]|nr:ABC transporter permease subunit [Chitinophagaceae bacterium]